MADENTVTTVFRADISNFTASTQELNRNIQLVNSQFNNATASMSRWNDNTDGLKAKITQLNGVLDAEKGKLSNLESSYNDLVAQGKQNTKEAQSLTIAINNQQAKVKGIQSDIDFYSKNLKELEDAGVSTKKELDDLNKSIDDNGKSSKGNTDALKSFAKNGVMAIATACVGAVTAFFGLAEATRETRKELGKIETAFTTAGFSVETARDTFVEFDSILGDTGKSTETIQQLGAFAKSEQELADYTNILTGVFAQYGNSIPTESLAEGIASTIAMGSVQGTLADALEWQGQNLDEVNAHLKTLNTEEERSAYLNQMLTGLYGATAESYKETNKDVIEAEKAQANLNIALAELGKIAEPIMTSLKTLAVDLLESITPFVSLIGEGLRGALEGSADAGAKFSEGLTGLIDGLLTKVTEALPIVTDMLVNLIPSLLSTIMSQLPSILQAGIDVIINLAKGIGSMLPTLIPQAINCILTLVETLLDNIDLIVDAGIQLIMGLAKGIIDALPILIDKIPILIDKLIKALVNNIPKLIEMGIQLTIGLAQGIIKAIPQLVSKIPQIITSIVNGLGEGIGKIFEVGVNIVKGLWDGIKSMFGWFGKQISNWGNSVVQGFKDFFGIHSPSKVFKDQIGKNLALGIGEGFEDNMVTVSKDMKKSMKDLEPSLNLVGSVSNNLTNPFENNNGWVSQLADMINGQRANSNVSNSNNVFNYTFKGMESSRLALHKANLETKRLLGD